MGLSPAGEGEYFPWGGNASHRAPNGRLQQGVVNANRCARWQHCPLTICTSNKQSDGNQELDCCPENGLFRKATCRDVRWSKFVGTGKERNAFFPVSFPFLFFPAHFRAHLYCQLQTVVARLILIGFKRFKILQTRKEESYP